MRIVIAGGGTGGHIFPGIAVAEEIKKREASAAVLFIGTRHGIEATLIPREGYSIRFLRAEGVVGKSLFRKLSGSVKTLVSIFDSYRLLRDFRPHAIIGVGGYASFSTVFTGWLLSIPTVIMEQNSVPGLANTLLGKVADAICVTYHESISFFPVHKTFITGNPIRINLLSADREGACELFGLNKDKFTVFVFGGSSGARTINNAVCDAFNHMADIREDIQFLHQTGRNDFEIVREAYREMGFNGTVTAFIHQMPEAYAVADIVIARAGATTLAELTAIGKPAILVPYPYAAGDHQKMNAQKLSDLGAAKMLPDRELTGELLARNIRELYADKGARAEMLKVSKSLGKPEAVQRVVDVVMSLLKVNKPRASALRAGSSRTGTGSPLKGVL